MYQQLPRLYQLILPDLSCFERGQFHSKYQTKPNQILQDKKQTEVKLIISDLSEDQSMILWILHQRMEWISTLALVDETS